jgi:hypothetical protein
LIVVTVILIKGAKQKPKEISLSMKLPQYSKLKSWLKALVAPVLLGFYGAASVLIVVTVADTASQARDNTRQPPKVAVSPRKQPAVIFCLSQMLQMRTDPQ